MPSSPVEDILAALLRSSRATTSSACVRGRGLELAAQAASSSQQPRAALDDLRAQLAWPYVPDRRQYDVQQGQDDAKRRAARPGCLQTGAPRTFLSFPCGRPMPADVVLRNAVGDAADMLRNTTASSAGAVQAVLDQGAIIAARWELEGAAADLSPPRWADGARPRPELVLRAAGAPKDRLMSAARASAFHEMLWRAFLRWRPMAGRAATVCIHPQLPPGVLRATVHDIALGRECVLTVQWTAEETVLSVQHPSTPPVPAWPSRRATRWSGRALRRRLSRHAGGLVLLTGARQQHARLCVASAGASRSRDAIGADGADSPRHAAPLIDKRRASARQMRTGSKDSRTSSSGGGAPS